MGLLNMFRKKPEENIVQKATLADSVSKIIHDPKDKRRGYTVFSLSELVGVTGKTKEGQEIQGKYQQPLFFLTPAERNEIYKLCAPILGVVTGRMGRISALKWKIVCNKKIEDKIVERFKDARNIFDEYDNPEDIRMQVVRNRVYSNLKREMPELLPDLKNFDASLLRWKKKIDAEIEDKSQEIVDWLSEPNINVTFDEYVKMWVKDLMIHGSEATYKEIVDDKLENFYLLPGGSVIPLMSEHPGGMKAFVQIIPDFAETQIMFSDEISYANYLPDSAKSYGIVPLESLINKLSEYLFVDKKLAEEADGTKPPEKVLVFGDNNPFGALDKDMTVPITMDEQKKIETTVNEARKNAIRTLTGTGVPLVLDLSRENIMGLLTDRQKSILKESIALVFNMTPNEMGMGGSEEVSGRATSESQERIELGKGIAPMVALFENKQNKDIIPYRYGTYYKFEYESGLNELAQLEIYRRELELGTPYNEIREMRNMSKHADKEFDKPFSRGGQPPMPVPENELGGIM